MRGFDVDPAGHAFNLGHQSFAGSERLGLLRRRPRFPRGRPWCRRKHWVTAPVKATSVRGDAFHLLPRLLGTHQVWRLTLQSRWFGDPRDGSQHSFAVELKPEQQAFEPNRPHMVREDNRHVIRASSRNLAMLAKDIDHVGQRPDGAGDQTLDYRFDKGSSRITLLMGIGRVEVCHCRRHQGGTHEPGAFRVLGSRPPLGEIPVVPNWICPRLPPRRRYVERLA